MKVSCLLLTILLLGARIALAGELTVQTAINEALAKNPEFKVLEADVASAQGEVTTANTWQNPELSVFSGLRRTKDTGSTTDQFHAGVGFSQLYLFPGKRALMVNLAKRNVELRRLALEGLRFQLATAVRKAFYELLAARKIAGLRREQLASAETFQQAAVRRAESGYASDFEAVKAQADVIDAKKLIREAEGQINDARVELNVLMGRAPSTELQVSGQLEGAAPRYSEASLLALAMARNPSLRAQSLQVEISGLKLNKTRFDRRPDFTVGPTIEVTPSEQNYSLQASVSLPLWNQSKGEIQTGAAEQRKALAEIERTRSEITGAVVKARAKLDVARDQLALYTPAYLDQLKGFLGQAERSYAQNATSLLIYLDSKRTYFDTLADYNEALAKLAGSRAELESALGVPLEIKP